MFLRGAEEQCHLLVFLQLQVHLLSYLGELAAPILIPEKVAFTHLHALLTPHLVILFCFCSHYKTVTACLDSSGPVPLPADALLPGADHPSSFANGARALQPCRRHRGAQGSHSTCIKSLHLGRCPVRLHCYKLIRALRKGLLQRSMENLLVYSAKF